MMDISVETVGTVVASVAAGTVWISTRLSSVAQDIAANAAQSQARHEALIKHTDERHGDTSHRLELVENTAAAQALKIQDHHTKLQGLLRAG